MYDFMDLLKQSELKKQPFVVEKKQTLEELALQELEKYELGLSNNSQVSECTSNGGETASYKRDAS